MCRFGEIFKGVGTLTSRCDDFVAREFPLVDQVTYLNNAAQCPAPRRTVQELQRWAGRLMHAHRPPDVQKQLQSARESLAELINADSSEIAFISNTSEGVGLAASSLPLNPGDRVLVPEPEHPSLVLPWLNLHPLGVEVDRMSWSGSGFREDDLLAAVGERTRVVALSHVQWLNGFVSDLAHIGRFCRERDIFLVVDGIQSLGVMPVDVCECDISVLAAGGSKWLMGGRGNGCLYVRADVARRMRPPLVGRHGICEVSEAGDLCLYPDARRFQTGAWNLPAVSALQTSVELLLGSGVDWVYRRARKLAHRLELGVADLGLCRTSPSGNENRSPIVSFTTGDLARDIRLVGELERRDIYVSLRDRGIRAGCHFFNRTRDVDRILEVLDDFSW